MSALIKALNAATVPPLRISTKCPEQVSHMMFTAVATALDHKLAQTLDSKCTYAIRRCILDYIIYMRIPYGMHKLAKAWHSILETIPTALDTLQHNTLCYVERSYAVLVDSATAAPLLAPSWLQLYGYGCVKTLAIPHDSTTVLIPAFVCSDLDQVTDVLTQLDYSFYVMPATVNLTVTGKQVTFNGTYMCELFRCVPKHYITCTKLLQLVCTPDTKSIANWTATEKAECMRKGLYIPIDQVQLWKDMLKQILAGQPVCVDHLTCQEIRILQQVQHISKVKLTSADPILQQFIENDKSAHKAVTGQWLLCNPAITLYRNMPGSLMECIVDALSKQENITVDVNNFLEALVMLPTHKVGKHRRRGDRRLQRSKRSSSGLQTMRCKWDKQRTKHTKSLLDFMVLDPVS